MRVLQLLSLLAVLLSLQVSGCGKHEAPLKSQTPKHDEVLPDAKPSTYTVFLRVREGEVLTYTSTLYPATNWAWTYISTDSFHMMTPPPVENGLGLPTGAIMPAAFGIDGDTISSTLYWKPLFNQSTSTLGYQSFWHYDSTGQMVSDSVLSYNYQFAVHHWESFGWSFGEPLPRETFLFVIRVEDVNLPPWISEINSHRKARAVIDTVSVGFTIVNNDCNCPPEGDTVVSVGVFEGATEIGSTTRDGTTCSFRWAPTSSDVGVHSLEIRSLDSRGGESAKPFTIEVLPSDAVIDPLGDVEYSGASRQ